MVASALLLSSSAVGRPVALSLHRIYRDVLQYDHCLHPSIRRPILHCTSFHIRCPATCRRSASWVIHFLVSPIKSVSHLCIPMLPVVFDCLVYQSHNFRVAHFDRYAVGPDRATPG